MLLDAIGGSDIVITTALIPGRPAPKLVSAEMVAAMRPGSVILDMAADPDTGGNVIGSEADASVVTDSGITIIGYRDLPSRLPSTASDLYANNQRKFLLSLTADGDNKAFVLDKADDATNCMLVVEEGANLWPTPMYSPPPPPPAAEVEEETVEEEVVDPKAPFVKGAISATVLAGALVAAGNFAGDTDTAALLTVFMLSSFAGYKAVWGVAPALHSPLMAETNAISGMTAVGGLALILADPSTNEIPDLALGLGALATAVSAINIVGGFKVTTKMLDLFRRPDDPEESYELYALPVAAAVAGTAATTLGGGAEQMPAVAGAAAAVACMSGIGGLSSQSSARMGNGE